MKIEYKDIEKILLNLNTWGIILLAALVLFSFFSFVYFKQFFKSAAEESYKKTIESFKNELDKSLQTKMGLFFRDESIRSGLLQSIGEKSFEKKIESWQSIYKAFFLYQKIWTFSETTNRTEYTEIDDKLNELRIKIFNETVYLGYDLSQKLIRLNSLMREGLRLKRTEFVYGGRNYQPWNEPKLQTNIAQQDSNESNLIELLLETELWVMNKLHTDQTIEKFEFAGDQLEKINEERKKQFTLILP
jgi:hypothetical protein